MTVYSKPWAAAAACVHSDPDLFFVDKGGSAGEAKAVCAACPVRRECLSHALDRGERFGVWGGMSERERHRVARRTPDGMAAEVARHHAAMDRTADAGRDAA